MAVARAVAIAAHDGSQRIAPNRRIAQRMLEGRARSGTQSIIALAVLAGTHLGTFWRHYSARTSSWSQPGAGAQWPGPASSSGLRTVSTLQVLRLRRSRRLGPPGHGDEPEPPPR